MADTLPNVSLPKNIWVNLYAATGITVGTQVLVQNIQSSVVLLHAGAAEPTSSAGYVIIEPRLTFANSTGDSGLWAKSQVIDGLVNVQEI